MTASRLVRFATRVVDVRRLSKQRAVLPRRSRARFLEQWGLNEGPFFGAFHGVSVTRLLRLWQSATVSAGEAHATRAGRAESSLEFHDLQAARRTASQRAKGVTFCGL